MRKALATISTDPVLKLNCDGLNALVKRTQERHKFLEKQAKALAEETDKERKELWGKITTRLKELGKLPDNYDDERDNISLEDDLDLLVLSPIENGGMPAGLRALLNALK